MIRSFRTQWLDDYYFSGKKSPNIPSNIESSLKRKLDILHVAKDVKDLRIPPGNRLELLEGNLKGWYSVRVNKQYRLIFKWQTGEASDVYLDPHTYK